MSEGQHLPLSPAGDFMPDQPDRDNPGITVAENCIPRARSYTPVRQLVGTGATLPAPAKGAAALQDPSGIVYNYAGDADQLYLAAAGAYIAAGLGGYALQDVEYWEFLAFLDDAVATGSHTVNLQVDPSFSGAFADVVFDPADIDNIAPKALHSAIVRDDFVMVGNLSTDIKAVQWCGSGNIGIWTPLVQQSGIQTLQEGGAVTKILGGEYAVIFKEHAIYRAQYVPDPDIVFQFDNVAPERGTLAPGSVVQYGYRSWYLDTDGFYMFDGSTPTPIGTERMNEFFLSLYDNTYPEAISSVLDVKNTLVFWSFPSTLSNGVPDLLLVYNWAVNRFAGPIRIPVQRLVYSRTAGLTSDAVVGLSDSFDLLSDSQFFKGGRTEEVGAFDTNNELSEFSGNKLDAIVESGEYSLITGRQVMLTGATAVVDGDGPAIIMQFGSRNKTSGPVTFSPDIPADDLDQCDHFVTANYHRFRIKVSGDWDEILGAEPVFGDGGAI